MKPMPVLVIVIFLALSGAVRAGQQQPISQALYKAEIIVTGKGEAERVRGFREGLREIFVKLTGDVSLETGNRLDPFLNGAAGYFSEYTYEDRMKNLPVRDEQGTRDRPHYLRMTADAQKIDAALTALGAEIWRDRPEIDVLLTVKDLKHSFLIGAETAEAGTDGSFMGYPIATSHFEGYEQREVLKSIAARRGLTFHFPAAAELNQPRATLSGPCAGCFGGRGPARYRGELTMLSSGLWNLDARAWGYTRDGSYHDEPGCFTFQMSEISFDTALRASVDAITSWLRRDKKATACGWNAKL